MMKALSARAALASSMTAGGETSATPAARALTGGGGTGSGGGTGAGAGLTGGVGVGGTWTGRVAQAARKANDARARARPKPLTLPRRFRSGASWDRATTYRDGTSIGRGSEPRH